MRHAEPAVALMTSFSRGVVDKMWSVARNALQKGVRYVRRYMRPCVAVESEGKSMRDFDFNDDLSPMIDQELSAVGLRETYRNGRNHEWILSVKGRNLQNGLSRLTKLQLAIIEGLFFEHKCLADICHNHGLSHEDAEKEICNMRIKLRRCL